MLKLPNSIEPAVMAENIVHLRDGLAAVDAKTLPATTSATTGQILKLTGETKTPAWADEYSYTPPAYSETETDTGRKWIDGRPVYRKVISGTLPEIATATNVDISSDLENSIIISKHVYFEKNNIEYVDLTNIFHYTNTGVVYLYQVGPGLSTYNYAVILEYVKIPTPGRAPEDSDQEPEQEPEEKKTTKKKTTK